MSAARGARFVALDLLDDASAGADRLALKPGLDALHDFRVALRRLRTWLRAFKPELHGSVRGKDRRRLRTLATATNRGRDADVQRAWLQNAAKRASRAFRRGAQQLVDQIEAEHLVLGEPFDGPALDEFARIRAKLGVRLSSVIEPVRPPDPPPPTLAQAIADRTMPHAETLRLALAAIRTAEDEREAHVARIAAKRLRYLLEPAKRLTGSQPILSALSALQDDLGALHDAHVLGHRLAATLQDPGATDREGLLAVAARLRAERVAILNRVERRWQNGGAPFDAFARRLEALAARLRRIDSSAAASGAGSRKSRSRPRRGSRRTPRVETAPTLPADPAGAAH